MFHLRTFLQRLDLRRIFGGLCSLFFVVLGSTCLLSHPAQAANNCVYTSTEITNDYQLPANWSGCAGGAPGAFDNALIPAGQTAVITNFTTDVGNLNVSGTIQVLHRTYLIGGNTYIDVGGMVTSTSGIIAFNGATFRNDGSVGTNNGTIVSNNAGTNNGTIDIGAGTFNSWTMTNNGAVNGGTGTLYIQAYGDAWATGGLGVFNPQSGTVRMDGIGAHQLTLTNLHNLRISTAAGVTVMNSPVTLSGNLTIDTGATLNVSGSTFSVNGAIANSIAGTLLTNTGPVSISNGNTTVNGTLKTFGSGTITVTDGSLSVGAAGYVTSTSAALIFHTPVTNTGLMGSSAGDIWFDSTLSNSGTIDVGSGITTTTGAVSNSGTVNGNSGTLVILDDFSAGGTFNPGTGLVRFHTPGSGILLPSFHDVIFEGGVMYTLTLPETVVGGTAMITTGTTLGLSTDHGFSVAGAFTIAGLFDLGGGKATTTGLLLITPTGEFANTGSMLGDPLDDALVATAAVENRGIFGFAVTSTLRLSSHLVNGGLTLDLTKANVVFFGPLNQGLPGMDVATLTVEKPLGTVSLSAVSHIAGPLIVTSGALDVGSGTLITASTTSIGTFGVVTSTSGTLTFGGPVTSTGAIGTITGDVSFAAYTHFQSGSLLDLGGGIAGPGTIVFEAASHARYVGSSSQFVYPVVYGQLSFLGTGPYVLTASTTALSTTTVSGASDLQLSGQRLTALGEIANTGLITSSTGSLLIHPVTYTRFTDLAGTVLASVTDGDSLYITVKDTGHNLMGATQETLQIHVTSTLAAGADAETVTLKEISPSSGIFRNDIAISVANAGSVTFDSGILELTGAGFVNTEFIDPSDSADRQTATVAAAFAGGPSNSTPLVPSSLSPTDLVDGSTTSTNNPTFRFTLSDPDGADTVRYLIEIDDSSDFLSPVVSYTSDLQAQGPTSFQVGQAAGTGTYTAGSLGQTLTNTSYYWRVKTIDNSGAASAYTTAHSGAIAFVVDTSVPYVIPTIQFATSTGSGLESVTATSVRIIVSAASTTGSITVNYAVTGGTASGSGTDFTSVLAPTPLTISVNQISSTFNFVVINDSLAESAETIVFTLTSPSGATLGSRTTFTYTIIDNDTPGVTLSRGTQAVTEGGATDTFTAVLNSQPTTTVQLLLSTTSTDFTLSTSTLTFTTSNWNTAQTVTTTAVNDAIVESTETGWITTIASSTGNQYTSTTPSISRITVTITDNDVADSGGGGE